jgi:hypothetical protein
MPPKKGADQPKKKKATVDDKVSILSFDNVCDYDFY